MAFKIAHFVERNRSYQSAKFHWLRISGSNFMRKGVGKRSPPDLQALKIPVLTGFIEDEECKEVL